MSLRTSDEVRARIDALRDAGWRAVALAVGIERGLLGALAEGDGHDTAGLAARTGLPPELVGAVLDVLAAEGLVEAGEGGWRAAPGVRALAASPDAPRVQAALREDLAVQGHAARSASEPDRPLLGWRGDDLLAVSARAARAADRLAALVDGLLPRLGDLSARISAPGAALLDVGAGAAGFAVAAARRFPHLRVVGVEAFPEARSAGWSAVFEAGLAERVTLHADGPADEAAFDLAWVDQALLPDAAWTTTLPAVVRALRPGGWLVTLAEVPADDGGRAAVARLRDRLRGGGGRTAAILGGDLRAAGLVEVVEHAAGEGTTMVAGRRAP